MLLETKKSIKTITDYIRILGMRRSSPGKAGQAYNFKADSSITGRISSANCSQEVLAYEHESPILFSIVPGQLACEPISADLGYPALACFDGILYSIPLPPSLPSLLISHDGDSKAYPWRSRCLNVWARGRS